MERNLVKHGESTLMISLPKKWLNKYSLSKGDKVLIKETEEGLTLSTADIKPMNRHATVRTDYLTVRTLSKAIITGYIKGFNIIHLQYRLGEILDEKSGEKLHVSEVLNTILRDVIGMEITGTSKGQIIISDVSGANENRFDVVFDRMFALLQSALLGILTALKEKDLNDLHMKQNDIKNVRRFTHLALRLIHKHNFPHVLFRSDYQGLVMNVDEMLDTILHWTSGDWDGVMKKLTKQSLDLFTIEVELATALKKLYDEYSNQGANAAAKQIRIIFDTVKEKWSKVTVADMRFMQSMVSINARMYYISGRIVGLQIQKEYS